MKLKYLLVSCAALLTCAQNVVAKKRARPSDSAAVKFLEIQGINSHYADKLESSLEMVDKEINARLLSMTPLTQRGKMRALISRYIEDMHAELTHPEMERQCLDQEKRAVQKLFTQEEVDVINRFFSSAQGKNILKKIRNRQRRSGGIRNYLSRSEIEKISEAFGDGAGKSALGKIERFDKLNDKIIHRTLSDNFSNASDRYTPAFEEQAHRLLSKRNKFLPNFFK